MSDEKQSNNQTVSMPISLVSDSEKTAQKQGSKKEEKQPDNMADLPSDSTSNKANQKQGNKKMTTTTEKDDRKTVRAIVKRPIYTQPNKLPIIPGKEIVVDSETARHWVVVGIICLKEGEKLPPVKIETTHFPMLSSNSLPSVPLLT